MRCSILAAVHNRPMPHRHPPLGGAARERGMGKVSVLEALDRHAEMNYVDGRPLAGSELKLICCVVTELVDALTAERAIRNSETKPALDVEYAAYARTDKALADMEAL